MQAGGPLPPLLVLGAGAWGTALAIHFAGLVRERGGGPLWLWARDALQAEEMASARCNPRYLPGFALPEPIRIAHDLGQACHDWRQAGQAQETVGDSVAGLLVLAGPLSSLESLADGILHQLGAQPHSGEGLIWLAKGLLFDERTRTTRFASDLLAPLSAWPQGALSGPSFAQEVAHGLPSALALASAQLDWARTVAQRLHGGSMRIYPTSDLAGVQLGGAMKNVLAIAAGVSDGLALGGNARAALLTRGLAEAARLGYALGARGETFLGLGALGDLILTATGDLSRNRRVGLLLARGGTLSTILSEIGHVAEGVGAAPALAKLSRDLGVDCPIVAAVDDLLAGRLQVAQACDRLMARAMSREQV